MKENNNSNANRCRISRILGALAFVVLPVTAANAQDLIPGDIVQLVERDPHIPAHPFPGDSNIHLRFISGSRATVLGIDHPTGWIEITGEPLVGNQNTGWVTSKYIAKRLAGEDPVVGPLSWCPAKGSPNPHVSGRLRIATWNIGNLHAQDGESTLSSTAARS